MQRKPADAATQSATRNSETESAVLLLEITRGQTRYPYRPVLSDRFLIGSSPTCDLCAGGSAMPSLHSMIVCENGEHRWEAVMSRPAVIHNGQPAESFLLKSGDRVVIGSIELAVHAVNRSDIVDVPSSQVMPDFNDKPEDLSLMSAAELLDFMERDCELVDEFETRKQLGMSALLDAVRQHAEVQPAARPKPVVESAPADIDHQQLLVRLEQMAVQLNRCATELERRATAIAADHERLAETLHTVMDAERHLAERLATVLDKLPVASAETGERSAA